MTERLNGANFTMLLAAGAFLGAAVGAVTARRSEPDDVITGQVSIDLLKKVELLTIRLRFHRS